MDRGSYPPPISPRIKQLTKCTLSTGGDDANAKLQLGLISSVLFSRSQSLLITFPPPFLSLFSCPFFVSPPTVLRPFLFHASVLPSIYLLKFFFIRKCIFLIYFLSSYSFIFRLPSLSFLLSYDCCSHNVTVFYFSCTSWFRPR